MLKNIDNGRSESLGIDYKKLVQGAIIGSAIMYDVKQYKKKTELEIDRTKPLADIKKFGFSRYGFMIKNSHRLRIYVIITIRHRMESSYLRQLRHILV